MLLIAAGMLGATLFYMVRRGERQLIEQELGTVNGMEVELQRVELSPYLTGDEARTKQLDDTWTVLQSKANDGTIQAPALEKLQKQIDDATADDKLTAEEADAILAAGKALAR